MFVYVGARARVCACACVCACVLKYEFKAELVNELQRFSKVFTMNTFILYYVAEEIALLVSRDWMCENLCWELKQKIQMKNWKNDLKTMVITKIITK